MAPDPEPTTIRTARGEYRLAIRHAAVPVGPREWVVTLHDGAGVHLIVAWWVPTEADARRVAARLDLDVRENRIE